MKINGGGPGVPTSATDQLGKTPDVSVGGAARSEGSARQSSSDQLTLSSEAKFMQTVAEKASGEPAVRQDLVDRMKALLDKGQIGDDAGTLADSLIDDVLKQS